MSKKKTIKFEITTPEKLVYEDEVDQLTVDTKEGGITIYPDHTPLVAAVRAGEMIVEKDGKKTPMAVSGGFVQVQLGSKVVILADTAERVEEIDAKKAEEAKKKAEKLLEQKLSAAEIADAEASLARSIARLKLVSKYKKRTRL